jgi:hypothetical protein
LREPLTLYALFGPMAQCLPRRSGCRRAQFATLCQRVAHQGPPRSGVVTRRVSELWGRSGPIARRMITQRYKPSPATPVVESITEDVIKVPPIVVAGAGTTVGSRAGNQRRLIQETPLTGSLRWVQRYGPPKAARPIRFAEKDRTGPIHKSDNARSSRGAKCRRACVRRAPHRILDPERL